jgi:hypothetical protein
MAALALLGGFLVGLIIGLVIGWGKGISSQKNEVAAAQRTLNGQ